MKNLKEVIHKIINKIVKLSQYLIKVIVDYFVRTLASAAWTFNSAQVVGARNGLNTG